MAAAKEIRTQISSIKNTQKITSAMEMVAASKMRKAQAQMQSARPYAQKIRNVVAHLATSNTEYQHPYVIARDVKRVGLITISTDRGLCGGLNANLFRLTLGHIKEWHSQNTELVMSAIGTKGIGFYNRLGVNIISQVNHLGDTPAIDDIIGTVKVMLDAYLEEQVDQVFLVYNTFVNSMTQRPEFEQILPLKPAESDEMQHHWDYIYEPDAKDVIDILLDRYIESLVYQGLVENIASEQAARMVAMKSASDNAGKLIDELQLIYNKARQAAITQELSEIVSGAAAV